MTSRELDLVNLTDELYKRFKSIQKESAFAYTKLIDELSETYGDSKYWWATHLSSRNVYLSKSFEYFCLSKLALEVTKKEEIEKVIVPHYAVAQCLRDNGVSCEVVSNREKVNKLKHLLVRCNGWRLYVNKKQYAKHKAKAISDKFVGQRVFLVDTYRVAGEFINGFKDRYFDGLANNCDRNVAFMCQLSFDKKDDCDKIISGLEQNENMVVSEKYIRSLDFLRIFKFWNFCKKISFKDCFCERIRVDSILSADIYDNMGSENSYQGLLLADLILRAQNKNNWDIEAVMGWYEGQPSSNAMFFEIRKNMDCPTVGYELIPADDNNLAQAPSNYQTSHRVVPEYIAVCGNKWGQTFTKFCEQVKLVNVPSFRYQNVFDFNNEQSEKKEILLVMPYIKVYGKKLIEYIESAKLNSNNKILIKNHPVNINFSLKDYGVDDSKLQYRYEFVSGDMADVLLRAKIAIMASSSSALEVAALGTRVIMLDLAEYKTPVFLPGDWNNDSIILVTSQSDFAKAMEVTINADETQIVVEDYFTLNNKCNISNFIKEIGIK